MTTSNFKKWVFLGFLLVSPLGFADDSSLVQKPINVSVEDFGCMLDMQPVRVFFVDNLIDNIEATLKVSRDGVGEYPAGSVVQLLPTEVMVKHRKGYSPDTQDWEFLELDLSSTEPKIMARGFAEVENRFGGNCLSW